jgi:hypothetical protein
MSRSTSKGLERMEAVKQLSQDIVIEKEVIACKQSIEVKEEESDLREVHEHLSPRSYQGKNTQGFSRRAKQVISDGKKMG